MINNKLNNQQRATKAVILARVSSIEQKDGYSLAAQEINAKTYCSNKGYHVLKVFSFVESSTQGYRKQFHEMLDYIRKQSDSIAIISDDVSRFQRSFKETLELDPMIKAGKVELHFLKNGLIVHKDSTASDTTMWRMCVLMAENYVLTLRDNTKRGLNQKIKDGEFPSKAPLGYRNIEINGKKTIIVDPDVGPLVQDLFKKYATGTWSVAKIAKFLKKQQVVSCRNTSICPATIHRILTNPFYYGVMCVKGQLLKHKYPPLITEELFNKCQEVRNGYNKDQSRYNTKDFAFKGILTCGCCGRLISSYDRIKRNKGNGKEHHYTYLRCAGRANPRRYPGTRCSCKNIREDELLKQVETALAGLQVPPEALAFSVEDRQANMENEIRKQEASRNRLQARLQQINKEKGVWIAKEAKGLMGEEEVNNKLTALKEEEAGIKKELENTPQITQQSIVNLKRVQALIKKLPKLFRSSHAEQKQQILKLLCANLTLKGKKLHFTYKKPFSYFAEGSNRLVMGG